MTKICKFLLSKCSLPDHLTCQTLLSQIRGIIGLKGLKNVALFYPLFVHSIEVWHFTNTELTQKTRLFESMNQFWNIKILVFDSNKYGRLM